ncbi:MAG: hypothetical protein EOO05_17270, partial [Chitinophagaceae bacterium]
MKKILPLLFATLVCSTTIFAQLPDNDMLGAARIKSGMRSKRVSSYDTTGGNKDRIENIQPGQTKRIFDVKGAGIINHIWITIAPGTDIIKRDDLVIRMYWDGLKGASVA